VGVYFRLPSFPTRSKAEPAETAHFSLIRYSTPGRIPKRVEGDWKPWGVEMLVQVQVLYISTRSTHALLMGYSAARSKVAYSRERTVSSLEV